MSRPRHGECARAPQRLTGAFFPGIPERPKSPWSFPRYHRSSLALRRPHLRRPRARPGRRARSRSTTRPSFRRSRRGSTRSPYKGSPSTRSSRPPCTFSGERAHQGRSRLTDDQRLFLTAKRVRRARPAPPLLVRRVSRRELPWTSGEWEALLINAWHR